ncbi:MAG: asparagine synthase (glutamine-hydrolyzing) [Candidatus Riflebacteria bacterium]|nr:asparagine synthase (glutamine-hydrolyzing) [Candidatus Riflebacteria bacterium]
MCSIAGGTLSREKILEISRAMAHRGPDDSGFFEDNFIKLAHNRLAIIDLSESASQPMFFEDLVLVFNGEIYNFQEIRNDLIKLGYKFSSQSDTEVLLKAFHRYGSNCLEKLNGDFSFCIYNKVQKKLFLARDRLGNKPLFYWFKNGEFCFASECSAFLKNFQLTLNVQYAGDAVLFGLCDYAESTIYNEVLNLPPAHFMEIDLSEKKKVIKKYWKLSNEVIDESFDRTKFCKKVEEFSCLLEDAVRVRLISDVKVGTLISGGLDSSIIAALVKKIDPGHLFFSASYPDYPEVDETGYAKILEKELNLNVYYVKPTIRDAQNNIDQLFQRQGDLFRSFSIMSQFLTIKEASKTVKVILSGQGADELFGGYYHYFSRFLSQNLIEFFPRYKKYRSKAFKEMLLLLKFAQPDFVKKKVFERDNSEDLQNLRKLFPDYSPRWELLLEKFVLDVKKALVNDSLIFSLPQLLRYEDRNSMTFSVENRTPFTDYRVVEFAHRLPASYKFRHGLNKYFLRYLGKKNLPREIYLRLDKMGFEAPEKYWLKSIDSLPGEKCPNLRFFLLKRIMEKIPL